MLSRLIFVLCFAYFFVRISQAVTISDYDSWNSTPICSTDAGARTICSEHYQGYDTSESGCRNESLGLVGSDGKYKLVTRDIAACIYSDGNNHGVTFGSGGSHLLWSDDSDGVFYPD